MKNINYIIAVLVTTILLTSCSTSDKVVSDNIIQKRKYNKGFHINLKSKSISERELNEALTIEENEINPIKDEIEQQNINQLNEVQTNLSASTKNEEIYSQKPNNKINMSKPFENNKVNTQAERKINRFNKKVGKSVENKLPNSTFEEYDIINLILIALLIALIIVIFSLLDGLLGGLLSLILVIFIILLLLRYFGVI